MQTIVSLDEFRKNLSDIVARVMYGEHTFLVKRHKRNGVVVISEREYEHLKDPHKRFAKKADWDKFFIRADKIKSHMSKADEEKLESILDAEIKAVREKRKTQEPA